MSPSHVVPFNAPGVVGRELEYISRAALELKHLSGDGVFTRKSSAFLEEKFSIPKVLLTTSCTDALEMSAILLNIEPGDEVIFPSFTFVSTLNAFILRNAKPIFVDIRPDTLNMDEEKLVDLITPRTKAIVPVHYAGVGCEMEKIMEIAKARGIAIVEDNAHGLFGKYKGQYLGTFGDLATQSFHETKNFTCGEGGALLINNRKYIERAEIIREKGTDRSKFFRGQTNKYGWIDIGSSFLPSDLLAAFLYGQLEAYELIQSKRKKIWDTYHQGLKEWSKREGFRLPVVPVHCEQAYHMFYLLAPSLSIRSTFIKFLKERGISAVFHYLPLHQSEMGQKLGRSNDELSVTIDVSDRLVRLPFFNLMSDAEIQAVLQAVKDFRS